MKETSLIFLGIFCAVFFSACVYQNECGISTNYYNDCTEYYDVQGNYHKTCAKNNIKNTCQTAPLCTNCN